VGGSRIVLEGKSAGNCHIVMTFESETIPLDISFTDKWQALGYDAHGCGSYPAPVTEDGGTLSRDITLSGSLCSD
jgi:hypothetical protein